MEVRSWETRSQTKITSVQIINLKLKPRFVTLRRLGAVILKFKICIFHFAFPFNEYSGR